MNPQATSRVSREAAGGVSRGGAGRAVAVARAACVGLVTSALVGGCVSQGQYKKSEEERQAAVESLSEARDRIDELREENERLQGGRARQADMASGIVEENDRLRAELLAARNELQSLEQMIVELPDRPLAPSVQRALTDLERQNPGAITFDRDRSMLRFSSDVTFDSGSDQVKDGARDALRRLAGILDDPELGGYTLMVVGHTDSERPSGATLQRFPTNMHLSVARAISVRKVLIDNGVPAAMVQAAGWGEHRPQVPNNPNGDTPANRRVELYLVPSENADAAPPQGG